MKDKRIFITHESVAMSTNFNLEDSSNCVYREQTPIDYFHKQKGVSSDDGKDCVAIVDPLYILLNQKRIQSAESLLGFENIKHWFDSMMEHQSNDSLAELRKQCSDEDLLSLIKPRNIQHPSEINSWANYMTSNMNIFKSELSRLHNTIVAETQSKSTQEPTKSTNQGAE